MKLSGRIILNVLHFVSMQENNVDVVFWVTRTEDTRNESSVPSAFLWNLEMSPPGGCGGRSTFQRFQGRTAK